ncbi:MAG: SsrA-binding protein SmpB [Gammaproteobacteria bacterium]|nr:SsrA-binding protein SmpB [Gammaproteobacteria bacterium]
MKSAQTKLIAENRRAKHDYHLEETFEAGLTLAGWEVKSLRAGKAQITESYVVIKSNEAWLLNANISPLITASTHVTTNPTRSRKLLLHRNELDKLIGAVQRKGFTLVPLNLHWKNGKAKISFALAKGKKLYDKRQDEKQRDWERQKKQLANKKFRAS